MSRIYWYKNARSSILIRSLGCLWIFTFTVLSLSCYLLVLCCGNVVLIASLVWFGLVVWYCIVLVFLLDCCTFFLVLNIPLLLIIFISLSLSLSLTHTHISHAVNVFLLSGDYTELLPNME